MPNHSSSESSSKESTCQSSAWQHLSTKSRDIMTAALALRLMRLVAGSILCVHCDWQGCDSAPLWLP